MKSVAFAVALGLVLALSTPAVAARHSPFAVLTVDGEAPIIVPVESNQDGGIIDNFMASQPGEWEVTINGFFDPDPTIIYAISVLDFGAPSSFSFVFSQPIVPTAAPGVVTASLSGSTTDGGDGLGVTVTPLAPPGFIPEDSPTDEIAVFSLSTSGGIPFLNAGLDLGPMFLGAAPSDTYGAFAEGPVAGPAGAGSYDTMRVDLNFSLTGGQDAFTLNGGALVVVPEPGTATLFGLGLLGLGAFRRRGRAAA